MGGLTQLFGASAVGLEIDRYGVGDGRCEVGDESLPGWRRLR